MWAREGASSRANPFPAVWRAQKVGISNKLLKSCPPNSHLLVTQSPQSRSNILQWMLVRQNEIQRMQKMRFGINGINLKQQFLKLYHSVMELNTNLVDYKLSVRTRTPRKCWSRLQEINQFPFQAEHDLWLWAEKSGILSPTELEVWSLTWEHRINQRLHYLLPFLSSSQVKIKSMLFLGKLLFNSQFKSLGQNYDPLNKI